MLQQGKFCAARQVSSAGRAEVIRSPRFRLDGRVIRRRPRRLNELYAQLVRLAPHDFALPRERFAFDMQLKLIRHFRRVMNIQSSATEGDIKQHTLDRRTGAFETRDRRSHRLSPIILAPFPSTFSVIRHD